MRQSERRTNVEKAVAAHKRPDDQKHQRQNRHYRNVKKTARQSHMAPLTELHACDRIALAGDDGELPLAAQKSPVEKQQHTEDHDEDRSQRSRLAVGGRLAADVVVDAGRVDIDPRRRAEQQLGIERLQAADETQHRDRQDHRREQRQGHAPEHSEGIRAGDAGCFFQRCAEPAKYRS